MTDQPGAPVPPSASPSGTGPDVPNAPAGPTQPGIPAASAVPDPAWASPARDGEPAPGSTGAPPSDSAPMTEPLAAPGPAPEPPTTLEPLAPAGDGQAQPAGRGGGLRVLGYLAAAVAGAALTLGLLAATGSLTATAPAASPSPSPDPSPAYASGRSVGDPAAPVTIEIWADFQCPYCGLQARGVEPTIERTYAATGRALVTYRDFAFLGDESLDAAVAARCADQQGAFWYMHDLLFASQQGENQGAFAAERLQGLAAFAGLDAAAFTSCVADPAIGQAVTDETAAGRALGIESTPTLRIIGPGGIEEIKGLKPISEIDAAFERAATPAPSASPGSSPGASGTGESPAASTTPSSEVSPSP
jgi:protein-disulfide isomerase